VHWPRGFTSSGQIRRQYGHIIDMVPTVLDALGIDPPTVIKGVTQSPLHGVSFKHTFDDPDARSKHHTQYYEMMGHRAIDHQGWRAVCPWPGPSFSEAGKGFGEPISAQTLADLDANHWELYHTAEDPAENHDLAAGNRDRLIELVSLWYAEAGRYNVLPIDGSGLLRLAGQKPQVAEDRPTYSYRPNTQAVPFFAAPRLLNRSHSITAEVDVPERGAEGVLICQGSAVGGWTLYLQSGRLYYAHNWVRREIFRVSSPEMVETGRHTLRFEFEPTGQPDLATGKGAPGRAQLYVDGKLVAQADLPHTTLFFFNPGNLTCGVSGGSPVVPDYTAPFAFTGTLHKVTVDLSGELIKDGDAELRRAMARQ
jgi:arylsulfatase